MGGQAKRHHSRTIIMLRISTDFKKKKKKKEEDEEEDKLERKTASNEPVLCNTMLNSVTLMVDRDKSKMVLTCLKH